MADINWTSTGAIISYCVIGAAGIGYVIYKKSKGSDTTTNNPYDAVDNTNIPNLVTPNLVNPTSGGKISRRNKSKKTNKTRNKKYKRS
jgi:hypothetical protein